MGLQAVPLYTNRDRSGQAFPDTCFVKMKASRVREADLKDLANQLFIFCKFCPAQIFLFDKFYIWKGLSQRIFI